MVLPMTNTCIDCGNDFQVGCMDGKRKRCWACRCKRAEARVASLKFELSGLEQTRLRDNQHLLDREAKALARVEELEVYRAACLNLCTCHAANLADIPGASCKACAEVMKLRAALRREEE